MGSQVDARFRELVDYAEATEDVLGLFVFGSRSREGFADEMSDYDVGLVVRDGALEAIDEQWPYMRGEPIEIASTTMAGLREHAEPGTPSEWARYQYVHAKILLDKTGELCPLIEQKSRLPVDVQRSVAAGALDAYVNATYRSMRNAMRGLERAARLDAAESIPHLLTVIFALERRVRPFNKYLEWELREHPLEAPEWDADLLLPRLDRVFGGDIAEQRAVFRDVEQVARRRGFGDEIDEWEPDVSWLRGESAHRANRLPRSAI